MSIPPPPAAELIQAGKKTGTIRHKIRTLAYELFTPHVPAEMPAREQWERRTEGLLFVASLVFFAFYFVSALSAAGSSAAHTALVGMWVLWAVFVVDYLVRLVLEKQRWQWLWSNWWEPFFVLLPMFRPLRVLRVLLTRVMQRRFSAGNARLSVALYTIAASAIGLLVASVTFFEAEATEPGTVVNTFGDAIWWAITTVTTVGYGDIAPVSSQGRIVGAVLMLSGIAVGGVVTAMVSAWLVEQVQNDATTAESELDGTRHAALMDAVSNLRSEMAMLRAEIAQLRSEQERDMDSQKP